MRPGKLAPFIHTSVTTPYIALKFIVALLPCVVFAVFAYGIRALVLISFSALFSLLVNIFGILLRKESISAYYNDISAVSIGILFALLLPPNASLIVPVVGLAFALLVVRHMFGGFGCNIFNSAVIARLFVEAVMPSHLGSFSNPGSGFFEYKSLFFESGKVEGVVQLGTDFTDYSFIEIFAGRYPSFIGTGCIVVILVGLVYLLYSRTIRLTTAFSFVLSSMLVSVIVFGKLGIKYAIANLLISGAFFVAAFLLTDYTNTSNSHLCEVISGVVSGIVFVVTLMFSSSIVAICSAVIVSNLISFISDYFKIGSMLLKKEDVINE